MFISRAAEGSAPVDLALSPLLGLRQIGKFTLARKDVAHARTGRCAYTKLIE